MMPPTVRGLVRVDVSRYADDPEGLRRAVWRAAGKLHLEIVCAAGQYPPFWLDVPGVSSVTIVSSDPETVDAWMQQLSGIWASR